MDCSVDTQQTNGMNPFMLNLGVATTASPHPSLQLSTQAASLCEELRPSFVMQQAIQYEKN